MDIGKIRQLLTQEEGPKLDFKLELHLDTESGKKELVKDVIAIANSRGGRGHILFGVEDKSKRLVGVDTADFREEQIQQIIYNRSDPPVPVTVDFATVDGAKLAIITIFRSRNKPHQMMQNGAFYVRRGSTTDYARRNEIAGMLQENGLTSHETVAVPRAGLDTLDFDAISEVFPTFRDHSRQAGLWLLEALGILHDTGGEVLCPTVGGLLLFGRNPEWFLPQHHIRISNGLESFPVYGAVLPMLDRTMAAMRQLIPEPDWPFGALEEVIANAIVHRDYLDMSGGIDIRVTPRSIEVINPGAMKEGTGILRDSGDPHPERRNPWLYQRLVMIDGKRRFNRSGVGLNRVRELLETRTPPKFVNMGRQNLFKVVLPGWAGPEPPVQP